MKAQKLLLLILSLFITLFFLLAPVWATPKDIFNVYIDGDLIDFPDAEPFIDKSHRTLVPVRFISENMGYKVQWDAKNKKITIENKDKTIVLKLYSKDAVVNGKTVKMDTQAVMKNNRAYVPLRFISEGMGCQLLYDSVTGPVYNGTGNPPIVTEHKISIRTPAYLARKLDKYGLPITPLNYCTTQDEYIANTPPGMTQWAKATPLEAKASNTGDFIKDIQADAAVFESKGWYASGGPFWEGSTAGVFNAAYSPVGKLNSFGGWSEAFFIYRNNLEDYYFSMTIFTFDSKYLNGGVMPGTGEPIPNSIPMAIREALIFYLGEDDGEEAFRILANGFTKGSDTTQIENKPFEFGSHKRQMIINTKDRVQIFVSHPGDKFIDIWGNTKKD